jgi:hypothetical protein
MNIVHVKATYAQRTKLACFMFLRFSATARIRQLKHLRPYLHSQVSILAVFSSSIFLGESACANHVSATLSSTRVMTPTTTIVDGGLNKDLWNGSDVEGFASLDHPGYALGSDPASCLGGWHAHRAVWEQPGVDGSIPACWIKDEVMEMITRFDYQALPIGRAPRILVLYGSLRPTSFSRKAAYEFARLLDLLGCDVRIYNPQGLPVRDPALEEELKVLELRALTHWR